MIRGTELWRTQRWSPNGSCLCLWPEVALMVKNLPARAGDWEMGVQPLGQKDPLEESMATHSSIHSWRIPRTEKPSGLQSIGLHRVRHDWRNLAYMRDNPLWYSCLENPRDGGAWWAAGYGVAQSRTRLKRLSRSSPATPSVRSTLASESRISWFTHCASVLILSSHKNAKEWGV